MKGEGSNKLLIVNARFLTQPITGVQRFAIEISLRLKQLIPQIQFVSPGNIVQTEVADKLQVVTYGKLTSHFWEQIELPRYLRQQGCPILLNLCNTAPLFYQKNIVSIHDIAFQVNPKWFSTTFVKLYKFLIPKIARKSLQIITVSNFSSQEISHYTGIPDTKIEVVYNGISTIFTDISPTGYKSDYNNYILAVSSIDPRKNLISLVRAFKMLNLPDLNLVIVGAESKVFADSTLKDEIVGWPSIIFTGYVSDEKLAALYKNACLFVYPSLYEGFGIPPLEAMASGCPTIVSNTSSLPEICGDASLYIEPMNLNDLVEKITWLIAQDDLKNKLRMNGYSQVKKYSWDMSAASVSDICKRFL